MSCHLLITYLLLTCFFCFCVIAINILVYDKLFKYIQYWLFINSCVSVSLIFFGLASCVSRILKSSPHPGVPKVSRVGSRNHSYTPGYTILNPCIAFSRAASNLKSYYASAQKQNSKSIPCSLPADSVTKSQLSHGGRRKWQLRCSPRCPRQAWYMHFKSISICTGWNRLDVTFHIAFV